VQSDLKIGIPPACPLTAVGAVDAIADKLAG
jgi:hypothetical protein